MLTLGIDPGTSCGWALLQGSARVASGVWDLSGTPRYQGAGMRFLRLRAALLQVLENHEVQAVAYEEVRRHKGHDARRVYHGLVSILEALCEERGIPYSSVPVGDIKKRATGKGNCGKAEMIAAANAEWDHQVVDDNEADALWVARCLAEELAAA